MLVRVNMKWLSRMTQRIILIISHNQSRLVIPIFGVLKVGTDQVHFIQYFSPLTRPLPWESAIRKSYVFRNSVSLCTYGKQCMLLLNALKFSSTDSTIMKVSGMISPHTQYINFSDGHNIAYTCVQVQQQGRLYGHAFILFLKRQRVALTMDLSHLRNCRISFNS